MRNARPVRVAIVTNNPSDLSYTAIHPALWRCQPRYQSNFFGATKGVSAWENTLQNATSDYKFAPGLHCYLRRFDLPVHLILGVFTDIKRFSPDVVVTSGYDNIGYWLTASYAKVFS